MNIRKPIIIVNFKTYLQGTGKKALALSKVVEKVSLQSGIYIAVAPQFSDIATIVKNVSIPVFAQHIDTVYPGSHTGYILPESIKEAGAIGTLINHSERRLTLKDVEVAVKRSRDLGLISIVCADTPKIALEVVYFRPDMVVMEPPELIGTCNPVSKAKPEMVTNTISLIRNINRTVTILCGAGITKGEDVSAALKLGMDGVIMSSGIVNARNPHAALLDIVEAIK